MTGAEQIIYFHGLPGSAGETRLFGADVAASAAGFHVVNRDSARGSQVGASYFEQIAAQIRKDFPYTPLHLVGFSLGASAALRTAPHLGEQVRHIDLVSAAAPLNLGSYLESMAGAPVFKAARQFPLVFGLLSRVQSAAATLLPAQLYATLFASAQGADSSLAASPEFEQRMQQVLREGLGKGLPGYRREILLYTGDWLAEIDRVNSPVSLLHGLADNWSPAAMAEDLAKRLPRCESLRTLEGQSHYSTLRAFLTGR
jgi:pimeloyl-ACP methyl ester carboxylesterase